MIDHAEPAKATNSFMEDDRLKKKVTAVCALPSLPESHVSHCPSYIAIKATRGCSIDRKSRLRSR